MDSIMKKFEYWYKSRGLTQHQADIMLEYKNNDYTWVATRVAYEAFKAGYKAKI